MNQLNAATHPLEEVRPTSEGRTTARLELPAQPSLGKTLFHAAWMAILLGLIVEALILIVATTFDQVIED